MPPPKGLRSSPASPPTDVDEAAEQIGRIFCPHDLKPAQAVRPDFGPAQLRGVRRIFDQLRRLWRVVTIDPGCLERFFLVQVPVRGTAQIQRGPRNRCRPRRRRVAAVADGPDPDDVARRLCAADPAARPSLVEPRAAALSGRAAGPVEFDPAIDSARRRQAASSQTSLAELDSGSPNGSGRLRAAFTGRDGRLARGAARSSPSTAGGMAVGMRSGRSGGKPKRLPRHCGARGEPILRKMPGEPLDLAQLACGVRDRRPRAPARLPAVISAYRSRRCCSICASLVCMPGSRRLRQMSPSPRSLSISASPISAVWRAATAKNSARRRRQRCGG